MAELYFKVKADWEDVIRMRQELIDLRMEMGKVDSSTEEGAARLEELSDKYGEVNRRLTEMVDLAAKAAGEITPADTIVKSLEELGDVSEDTRKEVEQLVNGLHAWSESAGEAFEAGDMKKFSSANEMVGVMTKELDALAKDTAPAVEDAMEDISNAEGLIAEASSALSDALEDLGNDGIKSILDLADDDRGAKYIKILEDANIDVGKLVKSLLPLNQNIVQVGDAAAKALLKTPGGPLVKVIGAVTAAVVSLAAIGIKQLIGKMKEAKEAAKELRDISQQEINTFATERAELDRLTDKLSKATEGSEEYQNTKNEIVSKFGKYDNTLKTETLTVDYLRKNYDKLAIAIQQAARERAFLASSEAISSRYEKNFADALDNIYSIYRKEGERGNAEVMQNQYDLINYMIDSGKTVEEIMENVSGFTDAQRKRIERNLRKVVNGTTKMKSAIEDSRKQFGIKDTSSIYAQIDGETPDTPDDDDTPKGKTPEILPEGSIAALKQRLSELNDELLKATTEDARMTAQVAINAIEEQITAMEFRIQSRINNLPPIPALQGITGKATTDEGGLKGTRPVSGPVEDKSFLGTNWAEQLEVIDKAASALHEFGDAIGGVSGAVVNLAADTVTAFTSMAGGVKVLESGVKGLEKASAIFAIIGAAVKILTAVTNIIKKNKEANEEATRAADAYAKALEDVADKARLVAERNAFGSDAYGMFKAYSEQALAAKKAFEALGDTQKRITADGRTNWQKFWGTGSNTVSVVLADFYDEFGNLDVDKLSAWYDSYGEHLSDENKRLVENMISEWDRYEEAMEGMTDYLSSLFGDTAASVAELMITSFKETGSALADMSVLADQFGENMAKSIVTSMLLDNVFTPQNQEEIKKMLLAGDAAGAVEFYERLLGDAAGMAPTVTDFLKGLGISGTPYQQQSTAGGFQTMSQDVATELNGRFTALQISNEGILQGVDYMAETLTDIITIQLGQVTISEDIRQLQADSLLALQAIRDNTEQVVNPVKQMMEDVEQIKKNTANL